MYNSDTTTFWFNGTQKVYQLNINMFYCIFEGVILFLIKNRSGLHVKV